MVAVTFQIRLHERNQVVAQAVLCAVARYASVWWADERRVDRRFATPAEWKALIHELDWKLPAPLADDSAVLAVLLDKDRRGWYAVQYLTQEPMPEGDFGPSSVAVVLDQRLRLMQLQDDPRTSG